MAQVMAGAQAWSAAGEGDRGILCVHGYPGSPASLRPLAEVLARTGLDVELPRLPGHGTHWRDLAPTRWTDWYEEVVRGLDVLAARTRVRVVLGLSNGAALALRLAARRDDVDGLVLVNPSVRVFHPLLRLLPLLQRFLPVWPAAGINDIARPGVDERAYHLWPLQTSASVVALYEEVAADLSRVTVPTLVFTSRHDHAVKPQNSAIVLDSIAATDTEQVWLERSFHVATLDYDADLIAERVTAFANGLATPRGGSAR